MMTTDILAPPLPAKRLKRDLCDCCTTSDPDDIHECAYCHSSGCCRCLDFCRECGKWACEAGGSRDCCILVIDGTKMCLTCAGDHVRQLSALAGAAPQLSPEILTAVEQLRKVLADLRPIHDVGSPDRITEVEVRGSVTAGRPLLDAYVRASALMGAAASAAATRVEVVVALLEGKL